MYVLASAALTSGTPTFWSRQPGEIVVEFDYVDAFLTQESENTSLDVSGNQCLHLGGGEVAGLRDAVHLFVGVRRGDRRVESRAAER